MNRNNKRLIDCKDRLLNYKRELDKTLVEINTITFDSEEGVKKYKQNIYNARQLSKAIDQFRKNYYLSLSQDDLNLLTDWTKLLDTKISDVSTDYHNRTTKAKPELINDLSYFIPKEK